MLPGGMYDELSLIPAFKEMYFASFDCYAAGIYISLEDFVRNLQYFAELPVRPGKIQQNCRLFLGHF